MSNTVWALATAGFAPAFIRAFDTTLVPSSQRPTNDEINGDPITGCFAAVASEAMRRPAEFKDQELKDVLWSFSKVRTFYSARIFVYNFDADKDMANKIEGWSTTPCTISKDSQAFGGTTWEGAINFLVTRSWKHFMELRKAIAVIFRRH